MFSVVFEFLNRSHQYFYRKNKLHIYIDIEGELPSLRYVVPLLLTHVCLIGNVVYSENMQFVFAQNVIYKNSSSYASM